MIAVVLVIAIEWLGVAGAVLMVLAGLADPTWFTLAAVAIAIAGSARHLAITGDRRRRTDRVLGLLKGGRGR